MTAVFELVILNEIIVLAEEAMVVKVSFFQDNNIETVPFAFSSNSISWSEDGDLQLP